MPSVSGGPIGGTSITTGDTVPSSFSDGSVFVLLTGGVPTDLYVAPGRTLAQIFTTTVAPVDVGANQIAIVVNDDGYATDLYLGTEI